MKKKIFTLLTLLLCAVTSSWAQTTYKITYNGSDKGNTEYFTHSGNHNFNTKFNGCTYDDTTFSSGLKMEGSTTISFTNTNAASVTIVQSDWDKNTSTHGTPQTIKFDGTALAVGDAEVITGGRVYTISNVTAGQHTITRGSGESGLFQITVVEASASAKPGTPTFDPAEGSVEEYTSITLTSLGATTILYQWGAAAIDGSGDWTGASTYSSDNKPVVPSVGSTNNVLSVKASNDNGATYGSATYTITAAKFASDLTRLSDESVTLDPEQTSQIEWYTSSSGGVTFTSSNEGVATVSSSGLITAVAFGTATITVNQAADDVYYAGSFTVSVSVNKVRKATEVIGEFVLDTNNGSLSGTPKIYTSNDGSVILEGSLDKGNDTYDDLKNSHFKHSSNITFTLPTNYPVNSVWFVGYGNGSSDVSITLKEVDGAVVTEQTGTLLKKGQIPGADCVGFALETAANESMVINVSSQSRGYFILNPAAKDITMTQVGTNYYASFYSAGEVTITGATAYTAELNENKDALILTECANGVVGGRTGVILIGNSETATATPSFTGAAKQQGGLIGAAEKAVSMSSYYAGSTSAANKVFVLGVENYNAGLYKYTGTELGVNKAYLYNEELAASEARSLGFDFAEGTTAINGVNVETVKSELKKFFENGKLVIEKNGSKYNAAGQQVK